MREKFPSATERASTDHPAVNVPAADLVAQNPGIFEADPALPAASARYLADEKLYLDPDGVVGRQTLERWTAYPRFLFDQGLLVGADGKALAAPLDPASLFTNDYLP